MSLPITLLLASMLSSQAVATPSGHWDGKIQMMPDRAFDITVDLDRDARGAWIGSLTVVRTTSVNVPLESISVEDGTVRFTASVPGKASFEGKLSADARGLSGTVSNTEGSVPFELTRTGDANVSVPAPSSALPKAFEGTWEGTLDVGGKMLRIVLKLSSAADGTATGTLVSVDQGNQQIPITTVAVKDKDLQLDVRAVSGTYHGTLGSGGEIAGEWTQGGSQLPLIFKHPTGEVK